MTKQALGMLIATTLVLTCCLLQFGCVVWHQPVATPRSEVFFSQARSVWMWYGRDSDGVVTLKTILEAQYEQERDLLISSVIDFLVSKRINVVYLFVGNENPRLEPHPDKYLDIYPEMYSTLISSMKARGIKVFALIGGTGENQHLGPGGRVEQVFASVLRYNRGRPSENRFDGVNLDIEPWLLEGYDHPWNEDPYRQKAYLELGLRLMKEKNKKDPGLYVGAAIPFWFDGSELEWSAYTHDQHTKQLYQHVLDVYDYVTIMAYRDSRVHMRDFALDEIHYGNEIGKPVVVGVETIQLPHADGRTSFFEEGESGMEAVLKDVKKDFVSYRSFSGFAIHELYNYQKWAGDTSLTLK